MHKTNIDEKAYKKHCMDVKFGILAKSEERVDKKTKKVMEYGKRKPYAGMLGG